MTHKADAARSLRAVQLLLLLLFAILVLRHAWLMDDAYITLRTVENVFAGLGPVWNPGERVQSYTHPLWMLICCAVRAVTHETFYSLIIVGTLMSTAALAIVALELARSRWAAISILLVAMLSHAFVDWSTAGMENPLTHLLIALFAWVYLGKLPSQPRLQMLCLLGGLSLLSRPDNALLLGPAVLAAAVQAHRRGASIRSLLRAVLVGGLPLYAWELFSLVYYGSLVPNTALAKLNSGVPGNELMEQGLFYFVATLDFDPLTLLILLGGMSTPLLAKQRRLLPLSLGITLHLLYTVRIGGDFMLGRFFTAPMFLALVCVSQLRSPSLIPLAIATAISMLLGLAARPNTFEINSRTTISNQEARTGRGVTDERTLLFDGYSLLRSSRIDNIPNPYWWRHLEPGNDVQVGAALGYRGFATGPDVHFIDRTALSDPLLARLPAMHQPDWMAGHFFRALPEGYRETLESGENHIEDPDIAELYRKIDLVVHGDLWSRERFAAIWWLNTGGPEELVDEESWQYKGATTIRRSLLGWRVENGTKFDDRRLVHVFGFAGVHVKFKQRQHPEVLELAISSHDAFDVLFYDGEEEVARVPVPRVLELEAPSIMARRIALPEQVTERGFRRLRIVPMTKWRTKGPFYSIGHLLFDDEIESARPVSERPAEKTSAGGPKPPQGQRPQKGRPEATPPPDEG